MVWTSLAVNVQEEIVKRLDDGESPYKIAEQYGLYPPSLARKYRRIKQKRESAKQRSQSKIVQQTIQIQKPQIQAIKQPQINTLYSQSNELFDIQVLGAENSLPDERNAWLNTKKPLTILFYTDSHFGDHDEVACDTFIRAASKIKHDMVVHGGDALEVYGLSRYGKDVRKTFTHSFKNEIRAWKNFSYRLNDVTDAPKLMIYGNHMQRYYDWLIQSQNQSLFEMEEMQLDYIMRLSEFGYAPMVNSIYFDGSMDFDYPNPFLLFHHGTVARKGAGNSAKSESENRGFVNSISGHTHRNSVSYKRTLRGQIMYAEGACLRTLNTDWMAFSEWQHGFLVIEYDFENKYVTANPINIVNGIAYYNGERI